MAASRKAGNTQEPMPGTLRWIMNGTTYTEAPSIEQIPVAARPKRPSRRRRPVVGGGGLSVGEFNVLLVFDRQLTGARKGLEPRKGVEPIFAR
jgi:hypothetical protein